MQLTSWQVRTTVLIATGGPPLASLILMTVAYLPSFTGRAGSFDVSSFVVAYVCFAVPVGYAFGVAPALLTAVLYCGVLSATTALRPGILLRACLGAMCGGLVGGVWFHAVIGSESRRYGSVAAFVAALLSLRPPPASRASCSERSTSLCGSDAPLKPALTRATEVIGRRGRVDRGYAPWPPRTRL